MRAHVHDFETLRIHANETSFVFYAFHHDRGVPSPSSWEKESLHVAGHWNHQLCLFQPLDGDIDWEDDDMDESMCHDGG